MEVVTIGKPAMNVYLPLVEFPQEGDIFTITGKNESLGNVSAVSACLLAKWGIRPHMIGVVGGDAYAEKIHSVFQEYKVNTKFVETNFENPTTTNYYILNTKSGKVTKILYNNPNVELDKFKYDFIPEFCIMDGTDEAGDMAFLNNYPKVKSIFYARNASYSNAEVSKKCTYIIGTESFAVGLTKYKVDGSTEEYVNLYQKLVDEGGNSNYIIILNDHKILYCEDGKVKMLPEMKINIADNSSFDSIFVGSFSFAQIKGLNLDDSIKFANTAAAISISRIGEEPAIPTLDETVQNSGLQDKLASMPAPSSETQPQVQNTNDNTVSAPANVSVAPDETKAAFGSTPIQTSTEPVTGTQQVQMPQTSQPVQQPAQVQTQPVDPVGIPMPEDHTTNIFDNPNV